MIPTKISTLYLFRVLTFFVQKQKMKASSFSTRMFVFMIPFPNSDAPH